MADHKITTTDINKLAIAVDQKGNKNNFVDTAEERSLFADTLKNKGVSDAKKIIDNYVNNPAKYESIFEMNAYTVEDKTEYAIYLALNKDSKLKKNKEEIKPQVDDIITGVKDSINRYLGFDDHDGMKDAVDKIDKNNVLQVLNAKYSDDQTLVGALIEHSNQEEVDEYGVVIIQALIDKASDIGVDITHIIQIQNVNDETNKVYQVAGGIPGIQEGASATNKKYLERVVNALKTAIEDAIKLQNGGEVDMNNQDKMYFYATKADANGDGKLVGDEVGTFKKLCAKTGILINKMLTAMNGKSADELTDDEKTLKQIFDKTSDFRKTVANNSQTISTSSMAYAITDGIKKDDDEALNAIFTSENINADNVEKILSALENNEEFMKLAVGTRYLGVSPLTGRHAIPLYSKENDIANKLIHKFGFSDAQQYIAVILQALIDKAISMGLEVDDIVRSSNGKFHTGSQLGQVNKDATSKQYADLVIEKLRTKIKDGE